MYFLVCYDVVQNRSRSKIAKVLLKHGCKRLQKSVFIGHDFKPSQVQVLFAELKGLTISELQDSLLLIPIEKDALTRAMCCGNKDVLNCLYGQSANKHTGRVC